MMKTLALTLTAVLGLVTFGGNTAEAGGCGYGYYGGFGGGSRYTSNYFYRPTQVSGHLHHNVNPHTATWGGGHLDWHDTSHYDYVPGGFRPHGNHFHYQPGGYIYHRDGHFDLHH